MDITKLRKYRRLHTYIHTHTHTHTHRHGQSLLLITSINIEYDALTVPVARQLINIF